MNGLGCMLRRAARNCLATGPLPEWIQALRAPRTLSVLTYHAVIERPLSFYDWSFLDAATFRQQMAYLKQHFHVLPLLEALDLLQRDALPGPSVAISFDDGFRNNFDVAFPVLRQYGLAASIYLTTDLIGSRHTLWFTRLLHALHHTACAQLEWRGIRYRLGQAQERSAVSASLQAALKEFPAAQLENELCAIEAALGVACNPPLREDSPFCMLGPEEIACMAGSGLIEFGAHSCRHAILARLPEAEQQAQIAGSLTRVEALSGKKCLSFAYPNGGANDFDCTSQRLLADLGVRAGLTMIPGINRPTTNRLAIHRYGIGAGIDFQRFRLMAHNVG